MGKSLPEDIKTKLLDKGFTTTRSNHAKFVITSKNDMVRAYISAYTGSNEATYRIGSTVYYDDFNECSIWVEAGKETVYTVSYAATSDHKSKEYPLEKDLLNAVNEAIKYIEAENNKSN